MDKQKPKLKLPQTTPDPKYNPAPTSPVKEVVQIVENPRGARTALVNAAAFIGCIGSTVIILIGFTGALVFMLLPFAITVGILSYYLYCLLDATEHPEKYTPQITCKGCKKVNELVDEFLCSCGQATVGQRNLFDRCIGCEKRPGRVQCGRCRNMMQVWEDEGDFLPHLTRVD